MTKKHFEMIAAVLCDRSLHLSPAKRRALASRFADKLELENPRFDRERFITACLREED